MDCGVCQKHFESKDGYTLHIPECIKGHYEHDSVDKALFSQNLKYTNNPRCDKPQYLYPQPLVHTIPLTLQGQNILTNIPPSNPQQPVFIPTYYTPPQNYGDSLQRVKNNNNKELLKSFDNSLKYYSKHSVLEHENAAKLRELNSLRNLQQQDILRHNEELLNLSRDNIQKSINDINLTQMFQMNGLLSLQNDQVNPNQISQPIINPDNQNKTDPIKTEPKDSPSELVLYMNPKDPILAGTTDLKNNVVNMDMAQGEPSIYKNVLTTSFDYILFIKQLSLTKPTKTNEQKVQNDFVGEVKLSPTDRKGPVKLKIQKLINVLDNISIPFIRYYVAGTGLPPFYLLQVITPQHTQSRYHPIFNKEFIIEMTDKSLPLPIDTTIIFQLFTLTIPVNMSDLKLSLIGSIIFPIFHDNQLMIPENENTKIYCRKDFYQLRFHWDSLPDEITNTTFSSFTKHHFVPSMILLIHLVQCGENNETANYSNYNNLPYVYIDKYVFTRSELFMFRSQMFRDDEQYPALFKRLRVNPNGLEFDYVVQVTQLANQISDGNMSKSMIPCGGTAYIHPYNETFGFSFSVIKIQCLQPTRHFYKVITIISPDDITFFSNPDITVNYEKSELGSIYYKENIIDHSDIPYFKTRRFILVIYSVDLTGFTVKLIGWTAVPIFSHDSIYIDARTITLPIYTMFQHKDIVQFLKQQYNLETAVNNYNMAHSNIWNRGAQLKPIPGTTITISLNNKILYDFVKFDFPDPPPLLNPNNSLLSRELNNVRPNEALIVEDCNRNFQATLRKLT